MAYSRQLKFETELLKKYEDGERLYAAQVYGKLYHGFNCILMRFDKEPYLNNDLYEDTAITMQGLEEYSEFEGTPVEEEVTYMTKKIKVLNFGGQRYLQKKFVDYFKFGRNYQVKFYVPKNNAPILLFDTNSAIPDGIIAQFKRRDQDE